jgi:hypothetical protein
MYMNPVHGVIVWSLCGWFETMSAEKSGLTADVHQRILTGTGIRTRPERWLSRRS